MPTLDELLRVAVLPAAVVLAFRGLAALARRRLPAPAADAGLALAVALALGAALYAVHVRPSLPLAPSDSDWGWVVWLAPAGALLAALEPRLPAPYRWLLRAAAGAGACWLVIAPVAARLSEAAIVARLAVGAAVATALWSAIADARSEGRARALAAATVVAFGAGALVYVFVGKAAVMGQGCGALSAALGAAVAPVPPNAPIRLPRAAAGLVALAAVTLSMAGFTYLNFESAWATKIQWPVATAVLVAAAPLGGLLAPPRARLVVGLAIAVVGALAFVVAGAVAGGILDRPPDASAYGY